VQIDPETGYVIEPERKLSLPEKIFGRNLDEFLAYRIGACVAVISLVLSIWSAIDAGDPLERSADSLMAAAAGLDLIAAVAGWALGAAEVGAATVATICSTIGFLGILAALAGIALLLYMIFRPQQNPVQQFTSDYARPAGFFIPYGSEVDYFTGYAQDGESQRLGCSFLVSASPETVLSAASDGTTIETAAQSFGYNSVFVISTNGTGQSRILALVQNESGVLQAKALTWASDNSVSFQLPHGASDQNYNTQLWTMAMQGPPQMDGAYPESAVFSVAASGTSNALVWNGTNLVLGSGANWTIEQMPMAMAGLSMENVNLYTVAKGQSFLPNLIQDGSAPQTWSIEPALPSFLIFDTTSGRISQTATTSDLPVTQPTQYTISVNNGVGTAPLPASFTIEVDTYTSP